MQYISIVPDILWLSIVWDFDGGDKRGGDWGTYPNETSVPAVFFCVTWLNGHRV